MARLVVLLSGQIASGKTTLADDLSQQFEFKKLGTSTLLRTLLPPEQHGREQLQAAGERQDRKTKGQWVADALVKSVASLPDDALVVVDSVRIEGQINAVRQAFGAIVYHVHLQAPSEELERRYLERKGSGIAELATYADTQRNRTERGVNKLAKIADVVVDTSRSTKPDVLVRVASHLGLYGREYLRLVDVLIGGQFGSEGKGNVVAYLAREYDVLVRVGGPNAGHKVYKEPDPYTFHHLPSGTFSNPDAQLILAPGAVIGLNTLLKEIGECQIEADRLSIDPQAMIISAADIAEEERLKASIGSTGQGVGLATARRIRDRGEPTVQLARDILALSPFIRNTGELLERAFFKRKRILLEGTQGTGLSLYHGFYPHVTSRDTTVAGCLAEAGISPSRVRKVIMVCRTYPIRVQSPAGGTSGPMSQEIQLAEVAARSGLPLKELEETEKTSTTKRKRRIGEFDWRLLRRAASLNAPTDIALTFADYISAKNRYARRFEQLTPETIRLIEEIERVAAAPVSLIATRFHSRGIIDRRSW